MQYCTLIQVFFKWLFFIVSGANVTILRDTDNHFEALYFSNKNMSDSMAAWPGILFIDGTYKLSAKS